MDAIIKHIDINADLGEGMGNDALLMPLISSCNIACGGHYGDADSMRTAIQLAKKYNVKIGAHPSFPDRDNFGRKTLTLTKAALSEAVFDQLMAFKAVCNSEETPIHHIKLHGALYNYAAKDAPTADAVVEAIIATKIRPILYVSPNSILAEKARNLLPLTYEAFIDRRYETNLSLVARANTGAIITDKEKAWSQLQGMILHNEVISITGEKCVIAAQTFCIHGDHEHSVDILTYIRAQLKKHRIAIG